MMSLLLALFVLTANVYGQDMEWLNECLTAHNDFRASRGKPPLVLNKTVTKEAQYYADELSNYCMFDHNEKTDFGENLDAGDKSCAAAVKKWTDEESNYNPSNPGFSMDTGHYTQVVWKSTTELGCGIATHCEYEYVIVCNYWPPGNYPGEFTHNV